MLPENKCSITSDSLCYPKRNKLIQLHYLTVSRLCTAVGSVNDGTNNNNDTTQISLAIYYYYFLLVPALGVRTN